jgi:HAD superfamily hydrolase (TIGR01450 family)
MDSKAVFSLYESVREHLPRIGTPKSPLHVKSTEELLESAKCFFLDAFGVLNVGTKPIDGAKQLLKQLRERELPFLVLTNSSSLPKSHICKKLNSMELGIEPHEIVSSREVLWSLLPHSSTNWGIIGAKHDLEVSIRATFQEDEGFWESDGFLFLSTNSWDDSLQTRFRNELSKRPRTLWVANPDITAPREDGHFSKEPGFYTLFEPSHLFSSLHLVGKPFENVFSYALNLAQKRWGVKAEEIMMVGDTLHTDILGANALGFQSALVEGYGFFKGLDTLPFMDKSGIFPDFRISSYM